MKLSEELEKWRFDRPDEWKMDEFIRKAAIQESLLTRAGGLLFRLNEYGFIQTFNDDEENQVNHYCHLSRQIVDEIRAILELNKGKL